MTREAYIGELRSYLGRLPLNEREAALVYYIEYFEERGDDEAASQELGAPREAAAKIIADYEEQLGQNLPRRSGEETRAASIGCLTGVVAVLGFPIWFPLLILALALLFSFAVIAFVMLAVGFSIISLSVPTGLTALGTSLFFLGLLLLAGCGVFWLLARGIPTLWRFIANKKKEAE